MLRTKHRLVEAGERAFFTKKGRYAMVTTFVCCFATLVMGQTATAPKAEPANAQVFIVHASADAPAVDVYINGKKEVTGLAFGKDSGAKALPAGKTKIELKNGDKVVLTTEADFAANKHYTVAAFGKAAELKAQVIEAKETAGKAHVIVFHACTDLPAADINCDGKNISKGVAMGKMCETTLDAGKHKFEIIGESAQPIANKEIELKADTCTCIFATGLSKGTPKLDFTIVTHTMAVPKVEKKAG